MRGVKAGTAAPEAGQVPVSGPVQRLSVAVETPQHAGLGGLLEYLSPSPLPPGRLVRCPLGRRTVPGIVWGAQEDGPTPQERLREVAEVMDSLPPLPPAWRALVDFAAAYYQRGTGELALSVLPPELRKLTGVQVAKRVARLLKSPPAAPGGPPPVWPDLTAEQSAALEGLRDTGPVLLHGATGSGKTEVYLRAADRALQAGRQVLVLVPEINLTPQLEARFAQRFPGRVLVSLHSGLTPAQRLKHWLMAHLGLADLVLGTRLAVFTPLPRPGLIVVDEEHDPSFKQDDHFRYHGRDMALLRAHRAGVPCVLGSATPSVETYHAAMEGRYRLLSLPDRATNAAMPSIEIVDLKRVGPRGPTGHELLSLPLVRALEATLKRKEQAILFLNRRGFAPSVRCPRCAVSLECPSCSVTLVLHRRASALRCHYCDFNAPFANACITCGCTELTLIGVGTEKLEHALVSSFPGARIGRLDRDVASGMGAEEVLDKLRRGDLDVLVGTQMVTKGHDIARVTLVGVIAADATLAFPDFRATERTFQLLSQVAGRAGRREFPGHVVIQTWQPEHPVLLRAKTHDYEGFYHDEVSARAELGYPPFGRLAALKLDAPDEAQLQRTAAQMDELLRATADVTSRTVKVLGPAPSPIEKLRNRYRMQFLLRCTERPPLRRVLHHLVEHLDAFTQHDVRVAIDVDPVNML